MLKKLLSVCHLAQNNEDLYPLCCNKFNNQGRLWELMTWSWCHGKYPKLKQVPLPKVTTESVWTIINFMVSSWTPLPLLVYYVHACGSKWTHFNSYCHSRLSFYMYLYILAVSYSDLELIELTGFVTFSDNRWDKGRTYSSWSPCRSWCALCCYGWNYRF